MGAAALAVAATVSLASVATTTAAPDDLRSTDPGPGTTERIRIAPGTDSASVTGSLAPGADSVSVTLPEAGDYVLGVDNAGTTTADFSLTLRTPAEAAPPTNATCGVDPQAPAITDNLSTAPPAQQAPGIPWTYLGDSNYDPCVDLSYAVVDIEGGIQLERDRSGDVRGFPDEVLTISGCAVGDPGDSDAPPSDEGDLDPDGELPATR